MMVLRGFLLSAGVILAATGTHQDNISKLVVGGVCIGLYVIFGRPQGRHGR